MVTLAYNVVKIIVTTKITHPRQAMPGGTFRNPTLVIRIMNINELMYINERSRDYFMLDVRRS